MKQFKKLFAGVLALCMLFTFMPAAMADGGYSLQGETNIFAPSAGQFAEIPYTIVNDATKQTIPTTITISGEPDGVMLNDSKTAVLVNGTSIESGSFTVTATATGGETTPITKTVTVEEYRIFEDFELQTAGGTALVYATKLSDAADKKNIQSDPKTDSGVKPIILSEETEGNKYVKASGDSRTWGSAPYYYTYLLLTPENSLGDAWKNTRYVTFEFDVKGYAMQSYTPVFRENASKNFGIGVQSANIMPMNKTTGDTATTGMIYTAYPKDWAKMQVIVDYYAREYTFTINGTKYGPYDMQNAEGTYPQKLLFGRPVDNISIYSGKPGKAPSLTINGNGDLLAPPADQKSVLKYTATLAEKPVDAVWSVSGAELPGVSISADGVLTMDGALMNKAGSFTIEAVSEGGIKGTKAVNVQNIRFYEDFTGYTEGVTAKLSLTQLNGDALEPFSFFNGNSAYITIDGTNTYCGKAPGVNNISCIPRWQGYNALKAPSVVTISFKVHGGVGNAMMVNGGNVLYISTGGNVGANHNTLTNVKLPSDEWSEIRLTMNFDTKLYSAWADDGLVFKDKKIPSTSAGSYTGLEAIDFAFPIDDFAIYSGEKLVADCVIVDGATYADNALKAAGTHKVKVVKSGNVNADVVPSLILAEYNGETLETITINSLSAGFLGEYTLSSRLNSVESGNTVKVFLWNKGRLIPITSSIELD